MLKIGDKIKDKIMGVRGTIQTINPDGSYEVVYLNGVGLRHNQRESNLELDYKETDVHRALQNDPNALNLFANYFLESGRIEITCQPSKVEQIANDLSGISSLSATDAFDYIRPTTEASHAAKFDILISNNIPAELAARLGVYFKNNGLRAKAGEYQINNRSLAEWLIRTQNILPVKWE